MAFVGWAGIGKSQIAIEYAHQFREKKPSARIFWVRGARADAFLKSCGDIARKLNLPGFDEPETDSREILSDWLSDATHGEWLMVLDNVDDETVFSSTGRSTDPDKVDGSQVYQGFQRYLPQVSHGSILITSRNRVAAWDITNESDCIIPVGSLPDGDAISLLRKKLPADKSSNDELKALLDQLSNLPLAITQAAAYISKSSGMTISRYLNLFRSDQVHYLEMTANDIRRDSQGRDSDFSNSVLKTWYISFNHTKKQNGDAAENLCFMSLVFGQGIPLEYLLCGNEIDEHEVEERIGPLIEFELISRETGGLFSIHRLVQLSVRSWLISKNDFSYHTELATRVLEYRFPLPNYENQRICELWMPHIETVLSYVVSTLEGFHNLSLLRSDSTLFYNSKGNWNLALQRAREAHDISKEHFDEDFHATPYASEVAIVIAQQNLGNVKEVEEIARSLYTSAIKTLNDEDGRKSTVIATLGKTLNFSGKYIEAEKFIEEALQMREKTLGEITKAL